MNTFEIIFFVAMIFFKTVDSVSAFMLQILDKHEKSIDEDDPWLIFFKIKRVT